MLIVANWKAYVDSTAEALQLFAAAKRVSLKKDTIIVLAPSYVHLATLLKGNRSKVAFASQDVSSTEGGAATGEVTATMLKNMGVSYAIIGHSERRAKGETNEIVAEKVQLALASGITPIICIGEVERDENGAYLTFIRTQLHTLFSALSLKERSQVIIAYEPIWAIGKSALQAITSTDLNEMTLYIRKVIGEYVSQAAAKKILVLYGGSVGIENVHDLVSETKVDGLLVGRASVDKKTFTELVVRSIR